MGIQELASAEPDGKVRYIRESLLFAGMDPDEVLSRCEFQLHRDTQMLEVAVSGGADSLALLLLGYLYDQNLRIWHLDHGLRPSSGDEARRVGDLAAALGVPAEIKRVVVPEGSNLEERARDTRRKVFIDGVATGHTSDDLVETMLVNLIRGSGLHGLGSIRYGPAHPILALRRAETERICRAVGLEFVVDESNFAPRFVRNRIRHEVLPLLEEISKRDIVSVLAKNARIIQEISTYISSKADDIDPTVAKELVSAERVIATEAIGRWLLDEQGHRISSELANEVLKVAKGERVAVDLPGAIRVRRSKGRLSKFPIDLADN